MTWAPPSRIWKGTIYAYAFCLAHASWSLLFPRLPSVVDVGYGGLNDEDLRLEVEINDDLRLSNHSLMKKLGSLGGL